MLTVPAAFTIKESELEERVRFFITVTLIVAVFDDCLSVTVMVALPAFLPLMDMLLPFDEAVAIAELLLTTE